MLLKVKNRAKNGVLDLQAESPDAPDAHKMLKVVVGGEAASLNSPEAKEKNGPQGPVL